METWKMICVYFYFILFIITLFYLDCEILVMISMCKLVSLCEVCGHLFYLLKYIIDCNLIGDIVRKYRSMSIFSAEFNVVF